MNRTRGLGLAGPSVLALIGGLTFLLARMPVDLDGPEWESLETCAENQKWLYQSLAHHQQEHGTLPDSAEEFEIRGFPATRMWKCPASKRGYVLHLENFGNPAAVLIAEEQEAHPTTLGWSLKRLKPHVQTMGDGTIHLFEGGRVLTMVGRKRRQ